MFLSEFSANIKAINYHHTPNLGSQFCSQVWELPIGGDKKLDKVIYSKLPFFFGGGVG